MSFFTDEKFTFVSKGFPEETFGVVEFRGTEGLSKCYEFEITLVSEKADVDMGRMLEKPATLAIHREDSAPVLFQGIPVEFDQMHSAHDHTFYRVLLAPRLWWLTQTQDNQVLLDMTVPEILESVLKDGGLTNLDYELRLQGDYSKRWEFICMYRESHFNFLSRWMEREGIYFYFEQNENGEKLIITDTKIAHVDLPQSRTLIYSQTSGLDGRHLMEVVQSLVCRQKRLPKNIRLRDYNYRHPSLEMSGRADVSQEGMGDVFIYGEHFQSPKEGDHLASIRAQELLCRQKLFIGQSGVPFLQSGYTFDLTDHYRSDFNQKYLTIEIEHRGNQAAYLIAGLKEAMSDREQAPLYENGYTTIPADIQFRPERRTEKPRFYGTLNARIDSAGTGRYAELDEQGRYKVVLPFDISGRKDGHASAWLRMAQPYAGANHGMHFPLHKGTEVLLTFIDGDPDRPIIASAVPNAETPSLVHSGNATRAGFKTAGGGSLHFEDQDGKQRLVMHSGDGRSVLSLGKGSPAEKTEHSDWRLSSATIGASEISGLIKTALTYDSRHYLTGFLKAQLMAAFVEELIMGMPELGEAIYEDQEDGESKKKIGEAITTLATPIFTLLSELAVHKIIEKHIMKKFANTGVLPKDLAGKPGFFVGSVQEGTVMSLNKSGDNIVMGTGQGSVHLFANETMNLDSAKRVDLSGQTITQTAKDKIDLISEGSGINLKCKPQVDETYKIASGDITLSAGGTSIYPGQTRLSKAKLGKDGYSLECNLGIDSAEQKLVADDRGPNFTIECKKEVPAGTVKLNMAFDADGPKATLEAKKSTSNPAQVILKHDPASSGGKASINANTVETTAKTIRMNAREVDEQDFAKIEFSTAGDILLQASKKITIWSVGKVFNKATEIDLGNLKIKK